MTDVRFEPFDPTARDKAFSERQVGYSTADRAPREVRLEPDAIVDGTPESLFAAEIPFRCLDTAVPKQKLYCSSSPPARWSLWKAVERLQNRLASSATEVLGHRE